MALKRSELKRSSKPLHAKRGTEDRVCKTCGKTFVFYLSQLKAYKGGGQFCSRPCSYAGIKARNVGKPIKDRYGRSNGAQARLWRELVREKDGRICQRCGKHEEYIHTHHVASRTRRPDLRYDVSNGKCLCGSCHQWVHHHPIEAEELGLLVESNYELERENQRRINAGMSKRLPLDEAEVVRLHTAGMRAKAIARQMGCSNLPITRILKAHGCPPHPQGRPPAR